MSSKKKKDLTIVVKKKGKVQWEKFNQCEIYTLGGFIDFLSNKNNQLEETLLSKDNK